MGAGTSAEEFFLKSINVESIFEFVERTDYLFLYSIKECVEKSDCHEGVYLSEVAEYMKLSIPETSKMVKSLENKGYIIWKLDEKKERTYLVLTNIPHICFKIRYILLRKKRANAVARGNCEISLCF